VILTRPEDELRQPGNDLKLARRIQKKYPISAEKLRYRADTYNEGVALAKSYAAQGKALIIAPDDTCGVNTLTREREPLMRLYHKGLQDGERIQAFIDSK